MKKAGKRFMAYLLVTAILLSVQVEEISAKTHSLSNSVTNQLMGAPSVEYEGRIYCGTGNKFYSIKKDGSDKKLIYTVTDIDEVNISSPCGFRMVTICQDYVFAIYDHLRNYSGGNYLTLISFKLDGSGFKDFGLATSVAIADGKVYYTKGKFATDMGTGSVTYATGIYSMNLDGTNNKKILSNANLLATDGACIYYESLKRNEYVDISDPVAVYRYDMKSKAKKKLLNKAGMVWCIGIVGNYLYYNSDDEGVFKINVKTGKKKKVYKNIRDIKYGGQAFVKNQNLYLFDGKKLQKVNLKSKKKAILMKDVRIEGECLNVVGFHGSVMVGAYRAPSIEPEYQYENVFVLMMKDGKLIEIGRGPNVD